MPYKRTGRPNGRPKADRTAPLMSVDVVTMTARLNVPKWWIAMAYLEAEWKHSKKWRHGSLVDLARNFTPKPRVGMSLAAVNKARRDRRYRTAVDEHIANLERTSKSGSSDCTTINANRLDLRATIEAEYEAYWAAKKPK